VRPACGCLAALLALWLVSLVLAAVLGAGSWVIRQLWPPNPERAKAEQIAFRRVDERDCHDPANVLPLKECLGGPTLLFIAHSRRIGTHEWAVQIDIQLDKNEPYQCVHVLDPSLPDPLVLFAGQKCD
jgi:hypothetical protein